MEKTTKEMVQEMFIGMKINAQAWGDMSDLVMLRTAIRSALHFQNNFDHELTRQIGGSPTPDPENQSIH